MREIRTAAALFFFLAGSVAVTHADDFGPPRDVGSVRADARMLLAHRARLARVDPKNIAISDVVVVADQAVLSWNAGTQRGFMGLVREDNRWWDALDKSTLSGTDPCWSTVLTYPLQGKTPEGMDVDGPTSALLVSYGFTKALVDAAAASNADVRALDARERRSKKDKAHNLVPFGCQPDVYSVKPDLTIARIGGLQAPARAETSGYSVSVRYAANNADTGTKFQRIYARAPTPAEFLPYPTPYQYTADALMFFDIVIDSPKPVSFQRGTTIDVWFPFNLDESLKYRMSIGGGQEPIGPVIGSVFDNVVQFELPGFTALPGKELMGEIDGDVH